MSEYSIICKIHENYNELKGVRINGRFYSTTELSGDLQDLLLALSYYDDEIDNESELQMFNNLGKMIGYRTVIKGLTDIQKFGIKLVSDDVLRELIKIKSKRRGLIISRIQ